jgi:hypothetical protein
VITRSIVILGPGFAGGGHGHASAMISYGRYLGAAFEW